MECVQVEWCEHCVQYIRQYQLLCFPATHWYNHVTALSFPTLSLMQLLLWVTTGVMAQIISVWLHSNSLSLRWTGKVTGAWWRSCHRSVRMRRVTRSRALCPALLAPRCVSAGGSTRPCAPLSCHPDLSVLPLSIPAPPPCRYRWSALAARRLNSARGE